MKISFLGQPIPAFSGRLFDWLRERLTDANVNHIEFASAWVKRSGLSRLRADLAPFRARGGMVTALIGIDEGGATVQGLELAQELFDDVRIFHDPASRTFHPKVYLASGPTLAHLLVGSNNVTAGGLFSNYEGALACQLDLADADHRELYDQVASWFKLLREDSGVCKKLTAELLKTISGAPHFRIGDEDQARTVDDRRDDYDGVVGSPDGPSLFGVSAIPKSSRAPAIQRTKPSPSRPRIRGPLPSLSGTVTDQVLGSVTPLHWHKRLSASDAQQARRTNSKITGNLRLAQAGQPIDQTTFFREVMFGAVPWATTTTRGKAREEAVIAFDVEVDGSSYGIHNLKIDHASSRVAGQRNTPTWLHWGTLGPVLRATSYTDAWVVIERLANGSYRLAIARTEPAEAREEQ